MLPYLGKLYLDDIQTSDLEDWLGGIDDAGQHKRITINGWLRVVKSCIGDGRAEMDLTNPAARVKPLPERPSEKEGLTNSQLYFFSYGLRSRGHRPSGRGAGSHGYEVG